MIRGCQIASGPRLMFSLTDAGNGRLVCVVAAMEVSAWLALDLLRQWRIVSPMNVSWVHYHQDSNLIIYAVIERVRIRVT